MKVIKNSITDDLHQKCVIDIEDKKPKSCWTSSSLVWPPEIRQGIDGSCIFTPVSDNICKLLKQELDPLLPKPYGELIFQYYIWQWNSGISWHQDKFRFGATLYLNDFWNANGGGWFMWEDVDGYHSLLPEKNLLSINDNNEYHCVTPVSPNAPMFRYTIQIWGK